jgi:hypothetical protein
MNRFSFLNSLAGQSAESVHGEIVQYYYYGEHEPYEYAVLVERQYDKIVKEVGDLSAPSWIVSFATSANKSLGVSPINVNTDSDCVLIAVHPGEEPIMRSVVKIVSSHANRTRLLIQ